MCTTIQPGHDFKVILNKTHSSIESPGLILADLFRRFWNFQGKKLNLRHTEISKKSRSFSGNGKFNNAKRNPWNPEKYQRLSTNFLIGPQLSSKNLSWNASLQLALWVYWPCLWPECQKLPTCKAVYGSLIRGLLEPVERIFNIGLMQSYFEKFRDFGKSQTLKKSLSILNWNFKKLELKFKKRKQNKI